MKTCQERNHPDMCLIDFDVEYSFASWRERHHRDDRSNAQLHICINLSLSRKFAFTAAEFALYCFALGDISINEIDGDWSKPSEMPWRRRKRQSEHHLCVAEWSPAQLCFPELSRALFFLRASSAQVLGTYINREATVRQLFCCVAEHSGEFPVDPQHVKVMVVRITASGESSNNPSSCSFCLSRLLISLPSHCSSETAIAL